MKKFWSLVLMIALIGVLAACGNEEEVEPAPAPELLPLQVDLTVTEAVEVDETVTLSTLVTMGDRKLDEADEVIYEIWEEGKKSESVQIDSVNEGEGIYTAETTFDHDGTFNVQVHVTAEAQHSMPIAIVTVGNGGEYDEDETAHDYHTEGFSMHFMKPKEAAVDQEEALTVHIQLHEEPLEELAVVRYEIWHENDPDNRDWVDATELEAGEYSANYTFKESGAYTVVVHVEDDADLHEHVEHIVEVK